jgi:hypothetical protein
LALRKVLNHPVGHDDVERTIWKGKAETATQNEAQFNSPVCRCLSGRLECLRQDIDADASAVPRGGKRREEVAGADANL